VSLRLTKQQREYQEAVLIQHDLDNEFSPNSKLADLLAHRINDLKDALQLSYITLDRERSKSIWTRVKDMFR
jgi:hypothetical protein